MRAGERDHRRARLFPCTALDAHLRLRNAAKDRIYFFTFLGFDSVTTMRSFSTENAPPTLFA